MKPKTSIQAEAAPRYAGPTATVADSAEYNRHNHIPPNLPVSGFP